MYVYNKNDTISFPTTIISSTSATLIVQQQQISNSTNFPISSCLSLETSPAEDVFLILFCLFNVLICITVISTNILFCLAVYKRPKLHNLSMVLPVSLSIIGIIISLFPIFVVIPLFYQPFGLFGLNGTVYTFNAIWSFAIVAPFTTITAIAFERYLVSNRREFHKKHYTKYTIGFVILIIWLYSLIWVAGIVIQLKENVERYNWTEHVVFHIFFGIHTVVPLFIICVLSHLVQKRVKWMRECARSLEGENTPSDDEIKKEKMFTNAMFVLGFTLFIFWIFILGVTALFQRFKCNLAMIALITTILPFNSNSPIILFLLRNQEVRIFIESLKNRICKCSRPNNTRSEEVGIPNHGQEINETSV